MRRAESSIPGRRRRGLARALLSMAVVAGAFTGVMGFLHTPYGRPLMGRLGMSCPAQRASPAEVEALRLRGVGALRGGPRAPARPALGLALDVSREADVQGWARARGLGCAARQRPSHLVTCLAVPSSALSSSAPGGTVDDLTFAFAPDGRLVSVETLRRGLTGTQASALFGAITEGLVATLGADGERIGQATPAYLDGAAMRTTRLRYRFSDYLATVTAMNLSGRVAVREQYQSAL
jgi:hypothetical protein